MTLSPLRRFGLAALLWLPMAFFLWFAFAAQLVWPVAQLCKALLLHAWPKLFLDVMQGADELNAATGQLIGHHGYWMQVNTNVIYSVTVPGQSARLAFFDFTINPMIYGYGLPLFCGLVMATPLAPRTRAWQIAAGIAILWLVQSFCVTAEAFKTIGINLKEGVEVMARMGYSLNLIALCYQFGYLILTPLLPAILWIVFNRAFIEDITGGFPRPPARRRRTVEPTAPKTVEAQPAGD